MAGGKAATRAGGSATRATRTSPATARSPPTSRSIARPARVRVLPRRRRGRGCRPDRQPGRRRQPDRGRHHPVGELDAEGSGALRPHAGAHRSWTDYPIVRFAEVPQVEVVLLNQPDQPFLGVGEGSQGPAAAAIANAIANATGKRLRDLPFTPGKVEAVRSRPDNDEAAGRGGDQRDEEQAPCRRVTASRRSTPTGGARPPFAFAAVAAPRWNRSGATPAGACP